MMKEMILAAAGCAALATVAAAAETRTVMWFVGHPAEMKAMLAACRNNPGEARRAPECDNVTQAELVLASAEANAVVDLTSPTHPYYWRRHPDELAGKIFTCDHVPPQYWHTLYCDSARASMAQKP